MQLSSRQIQLCSKYCYVESSSRIDLGQVGLVCVLFWPGFFLLIDANLYFLHWNLKLHFKEKVHLLNYSFFAIAIMRRSIRALPCSNWSILLHNLSFAVWQMLQSGTAFFWYKAFWFWSNSLNTGSHIPVRTSKQITPCLLEAPGAWLLKTQLLLSQRESIYLAVAFFLPSLHAPLMSFCYLFHTNSIQPPAC